MIRQPIVRLNQFDKICIVIAVISILISGFYALGTTDHIMFASFMIIGFISLMFMLGDVIHRIAAISPLPHPGYTLFIGYALLCIGTIMFALSLVLPTVNQSLNNDLLNAWLSFAGILLVVVGASIISYIINAIRRQRS